MIQLALTIAAFLFLGWVILIALLVILNIGASVKSGLARLFRPRRQSSFDFKAYRERTIRACDHCHS